MATVANKSVGFTLNTSKLPDKKLFLKKSKSIPTLYVDVFSQVKSGLNGSSRI